MPGFFPTGGGALGEGPPGDISASIIPVLGADTRNLFQICTYWAPGDGDGFGGIVFDAPISILCRWQDGMTKLRGDANRHPPRATVYVDRVLEEGGYIMLGASATANPAAVVGAFKIRRIGASPAPHRPVQLNKVMVN